MTDDQFWPLVESIGGVGPESDYRRRLRTAPLRLPLLDVMRFEAHLRRHMLEAY